MKIFMAETMSCRDTDYSVPEYCHDIQGALRSISGLLQIVRTKLPRDENWDPELISYINSAIRNVVTLGDWSRNLLLADGKHSASGIELADIAREIGSLLLLQTPPETCRIHSDLSIPRVKGNFFEILCAFQNLAENSIRHSGASPLIISISLLNLSSTEVKIKFSDNGRKLSKRVRRRINAILTRNEADENLGLSICKSMLFKNKGCIKLIESTRGCSYEISLAISKEEDHR
jgi:light-regulated signal transduction histidine kinase (bacteriophytochrome)